MTKTQKTNWQKTLGMKNYFPTEIGCSSRWWSKGVFKIGVTKISYKSCLFQQMLSLSFLTIKPNDDPP